MRYYILLLLTLLTVADTFAQTGDAPDQAEATTMLPHPDQSRFWLGGQINTILQWHSSFPSKYSGSNSFKAQAENATSRVMTLYMGFAVTKTTEVFGVIESAGGKGISDALGVAGFTNLDVVRNPTLGSKPYLARLMVRQIIPLSDETVEVQRNQFGLATKLPERRIEIRAGKLSTADFFDVNASGSDSHLQFMNWTVDNNGGYDYAADTRGYTWGAIAEYQTRNWGVRFGEMLMPTVANGLKLDWNLRRARAENIEVELRRNFLPERAGTISLLTYINHANMGSYREAIDAFTTGQEKLPDIEAHRRQSRIKYGFGVNFEQSITPQARVFGRFGWNEGKFESFAYTEVNQSLTFGADLKGEHWHRKLDKVGGAFVSNAISGDHRRYLALGGKGFLLGDGALNYGRENILEAYYNLHLWRGVFASFDLQHIANPGYNRDRGTALVPSLRLHLEF